MLFHPGGPNQPSPRGKRGGDNQSPKQGPQEIPGTSQHYDR